MHVYTHNIVVCKQALFIEDRLLKKTSMPPPQRKFLPSRERGEVYDLRCPKEREGRSTEVVQELHFVKNYCSYVDVQKNFSNKMFVNLKQE